MTAEEISKLRLLVEMCEKAVAIEREACAKIAEDEKVDAEYTGDESDEAYNRACDDIAAAIRARGRK